MKNNYVLYALINTDGSPFYIGIGAPSRPYQHFLESRKIFKERSNKHKIFKIRKILRTTGKYPKVKIYKDNLTYRKACELEKELILKIGINNLTNLKDGGKGWWFNSWKRKTVEKAIEKTRKTKMRLYKQGLIKPWNKNLTQETDERVKRGVEKGRLTKILLGSSRDKKNPNYGKFGKEHPAHGYRHTKDARSRISLFKLGLKNPNAKKCKVFTPDGKIYVTCVNEFMRIHNEKYKVAAHFLRMLGNRNIKKNNWKVIYAKKKDN
jgi:hypothetical protein